MQCLKIHIEKCKNWFTVLKNFLPAVGWRLCFAWQIIAKWLLNDNLNPDLNAHFVLNCWSKLFFSHLAPAKMMNGFNFFLFVEAAKQTLTCTVLWQYIKGNFSPSCFLDSSVNNHIISFYAAVSSTAIILQAHMAHMEIILWITRKNNVNVVSRVLSDYSSFLSQG